jgi:hypothetical protein
MRSSFDCPASTSLSAGAVFCLAAGLLAATAASATTPAEAARANADLAGPAFSKVHQ